MEQSPMRWKKGAMLAPQQRPNAATQSLKLGPVSSVFALVNIRFAALFWPLKVK